MKRSGYNLKPPHLAAGFTIIELLVAIVITTMMVSLAGFGLVAMMQVNQKAASETARRTNLNRSLDFIADEIRMAKAVNQPASSAVPTPSCGTATGVLDLTMPDSSHVVYYLNDVSSCSSLWAGPAAIHRVSGGNDTLLVDAIAPIVTVPTCSNATMTGSGGFYACIDTTTNHLATLYLNGKLTDAYGNTIDSYLVSSKAVARSQ